MAKARTVENLDCEAPVAAGASQVFVLRFDEMLEFHASAMMTDGVDGVHDMRVAARRFRSALQDFETLFEKKRVKSLQKQVKAVANALGEVRDEDVAIEQLESLLEMAPNDEVHEGIERLIDIRRSSRTLAHQQLLDEVSANILDPLRSDLERTVSSPAEDQDTLTYRLFSSVAIERAHRKFIKRSESIYHPFDDQALHKMRLSAKRLRYALELFNECWNGELWPFAKHLSKLQSSLGAVHDSAHWIEVIADMMSRGEDQGRQTGSWLISKFVTKRTTEYIRALELVGEWDHRGMSSALLELVKK